MRNPGHVYSTYIYIYVYYECVEIQHWLKATLGTWVQHQALEPIPAYSAQLTKGVINIAA